MRIIVLFVTIIYVINALASLPTANDENFNTIYKPVKQQGRIVGGRTTSITNYPFIVSVQYNKKHICGGSIIQPSIILTAAHCVQPFTTPEGLFIRAGSSFFNHGGQFVPVLDFIQNMKYNTNDLEKDLALLMLYRPLIFTPAVQPILLADEQDYLPIGSKVRVIGWGTTDPDNTQPSEKLRAVTVYVISRATCNKSYENFARITINMFCAAYPNGGRDSCQGDSGGPLIYSVPTKESKNLLHAPHVVKQYGTVSFGIGCASKVYPGVYANISALRGWIDENIHVINMKHL